MFLQKHSSNCFKNSFILFSLLAVFLFFVSLLHQLERRRQKDRCVTIARQRVIPNPQIHLEKNFILFFPYQRKSPVMNCKTVTKIAVTCNCIKFHLSKNVKFFYTIFYPNVYPSRVQFFKFLSFVFLKKKIFVQFLFFVNLV